MTMMMMSLMRMFKSLKAPSKSKMSHRWALISCRW